MFAITEFSVENVKDPFGILAGERYEFLLDLDVEEDDELYIEQGVSLRVLFSVDGDNKRMVKYEFLNRSSNQYIDIEMEEEEVKLVEAFCLEQLGEGLREEG